MSNKKLKDKLNDLLGTSTASRVILGDFNNLTELQNAYPIAPDGAIATVSSTGTIYNFDQETTTWTAGSGGSGISDVVDDTTPQLGGTLDLNNNAINGTGAISYTGNFGNVGLFQTSGAATFLNTLTAIGVVTTIDDVAVGGDLAVTGASAFSSTLSVGSDLTVVGDINAQGNVGVTGNITVTGTVDGRDVAADGTKLDLLNIPASIADIGTPASGDKILIQDITDSDNLKYVAFSEFAGGGISNVVEDTTPQLGGTLDLNGNTVGDASAADLTKLSELTATSTELNYVDGVTSAIQTQLDTKTTVSTGSSAPASTPTKAGDIYVDTTADVVYVAVGTASSADWQEQVLVNGTGLAAGSILVYDGTEFIADPKTVGTGTTTTIDMNSIVGSYYSITTASTASSYTLQNAVSGGKATIRIQNATSGGPTFAGTGITVSKKGDWATNYDTTNVNTIFIEMVNATTAWCWITAVD